MVLQGVE